MYEHSFRPRLGVDTSSSIRGTPADVESEYFIGKSMILGLCSTVVGREDDGTRQLRSICIRILRDLFAYCNSQHSTHAAQRGQLMVLVATPSARLQVVASGTSLVIQRVRV